MRRKIVPQIGDFETWFTQLPRSRRGRARRQLCRSRRWACADELLGSGNPRMRHCSRNAIAGAVCRNPRRTALHTHEKLSRGEQCSFAASRTPPWLASGWGCRGRLFHCGFWSRCAKNLFWHCFAADSNPLNSGVPRSFTSNGSVCKAV